MAAVDSVPVTIAPEAVEYIQEQGLQEAFERVMAHVRATVPDLVSIHVERVPHDYEDASAGELLLFDLLRKADPDGSAKGVCLGLIGWRVETFPLEVSERFGFLEAHETCP